MFAVFPPPIACTQALTAEKGKAEYDAAFKLAADWARPRTASERAEFQSAILKSLEASADLGFVPAMKALQTICKPYDPSSQTTPAQSVEVWYKDRFGIPANRADSELFWAKHFAVTQLRSGDPAIDSKFPLILDFDVHEMQVLHKSPFPGYPVLARIAGVEGQVVLDVKIGADGQVMEAKAIQGPKALFDTATTWIKGWVFEPILENGKPAPGRFRFNLNFKLTPPDPPTRK